MWLDWLLLEREWKEAVWMHRRRTNVAEAMLVKRLWCTGAVEEAGGAALAPLGFGDPPSPRVLSGRRTAEQGTTGAKPRFSVASVEVRRESDTAPEAVACSVPDLVMSVVITDEGRREHDTAGG